MKSLTPTIDIGKETSVASKIHDGKCACEHRPHFVTAHSAGKCNLVSMLTATPNPLTLVQMNISPHFANLEYVDVIVEHIVLRIKMNCSWCLVASLVYGWCNGMINSRKRLSMEYEHEIRRTSYKCRWLTAKLSRL
jgi:hypothetical protein